MELITRLGNFPRSALLSSTTSDNIIASGGSKMSLSTTIRRILFSLSTFEVIF